MGPEERSVKIVTACDKTGRGRRPNYDGCLAIYMRIQFNPANRHVGNSNTIQKVSRLRLYKM